MINKMPAEVFPPGEFIREEMEARGWTQIDLAKILGRPVNTVNWILSGKRAITPDTAKELAAALGTSPDVWLNLETAYRLSKANEPTGDVVKRSKLYSVAPINEMMRRGWIQQTANADILEASLKTFFESTDLDNPRTFSAAARKSTTGEALPNQIAWLYRAKQLARSLQVDQFSASKLKDRLNTIRGMTVFPENIRQLPGLLASWGIRFVVVEALQKSQIDGAAFWLDENSPAIAISVRFDRVDGFWHTAVHELVHIKNRDGMTLDIAIVGDSRGAAEELTELEDRTNAETAAILVPQDKLESFIVRNTPLYSKAKIRAFAQISNVHPGIVVGQLQRRKEVPYSHFREMLEPAFQHLRNSALVDGFGQIAGAF